MQICSMAALMNLFYFAEQQRQYMRLHVTLTKFHMFNITELLSASNFISHKLKKYYFPKNWITCYISSSTSHIILFTEHDKHTMAPT